MKKQLFALSLTVLLNYPVSAQTDSLIPREKLFKAHQKNAIKLSPDGDAVYFKTTSDPFIHFCETDKPEELKILSNKITLRSWEPYQKGIIGITADTLNQILFVDRSGESKTYDFPFKTQSIRILYSSAKELLALEVVGKEEKNSGIYRFHPAEKKFTKISELIRGITPLFDFEMNVVAGNTENGLGGNSVLLYNKSQKQFDTLITTAFSENMFLGGFTKAIAVSGDGNLVYFTTNQETDKSELYVYNLATKKTSSLAKHDKVDLLPFGFSTNSKGEITSIVGLFAKTIRVISDSKQKNNFDFLSSNVKGDISYGGHSTDGAKWLIREFTGGPSQYYLFDTTAKTLAYLFNDVEGLDNYNLAERTAFEIKTRDGLLLPVHVYLPAGSDTNHDGIPDKPLPTILYVHGGPWSGVSYWNLYFFWRNFQLLANRGYAVINCEFRGGLGYGKDFVSKSYKTWGKEMTNDKIDIAEWAIQNKIADKNKIGIYGWSYGGYAAMAGISLSPKTYACAVAMYGISDLESFCKTDFANNDFWKERVGNPETEKQMLREYSPIHHIDKIKAPLFITTGGKDDRIPVAQADSMVIALRKVNKEVTYLFYPNEEHDYRNDDNWISFWAYAEEFLAKHLGGNKEDKESDKNLGEFEVK